jgi:hypothetical protein
MARLGCAANYFELEDLEDKVITIVSKHMAIFPSLAFAVFDESSAEGEEDGVLSKIALGIIGLDAEDSLLPTEESHKGGVLALSAFVLERVLTSEVVASDNFMKYRLLQRWCGEIAPDEISCQEQEDRFAVAKELAKSIDFRLIQASDLAGITGSKLVTKDQLYDAFKAHALSAQEEGASGAAARHDTKGTSVLVTGAGVPEVNGKYFEYGKSDGVMGYTKEGTLEGKSGEFLLFRNIGNGSKKRPWSISFNWKDAPKRITFYRSELDESGIDTIPHNTWIRNGRNIGEVQPMLRVLVVQRKGDSPENRM